MRVVCISDTHNQQDRVIVPAGNMLIHAGDFSFDGSVRDVLGTLAWLNAQPHEHVIAVPGNHDRAFQSKPDLLDRIRESFPRLHVLLDSGVTLRGLRIWGSPWQPWYDDWAFNFSRGLAGREEARLKWSNIPDNTEILITHGPARGVLDRVASGERVGCPMLRARIRELHCLRLHVCGHIHEGYGLRRNGVTTFVNASICDHKYRPSQAPLVVDLT